jgi:hypothetical protein
VANKEICVKLGSRSAPIMLAPRLALLNCLESITADTCSGLTQQRFTAGVADDKDSERAIGTNTCAASTGARQH